MGLIVREENEEHGLLSIYHIGLIIVGYISFYNALVELNEISKQNNKKGINLQNFLCFANTAVLKDFSIILNEVYAYLNYIKPGVFEQYKDVEPRFDEFLKFIRKTKNNMKFHPSKSKMEKILLNEKNKYPNIFGVKNKDTVYYCGYFMGNNVIFGSSWYLEYIFYEPKRICKNDGDLFLFTNSFQTHIKSVFEVFTKYCFKDDFEIPIIKLKEQKRFFQIYQQTKNSDRIFRNSKYDEITTFMLFLILQEISSMQIYYDYYLDVDESINDSILLFFFTYLLAIKYDEIRDCILNLINNAEKLGVDKHFEFDFQKLEVFDKKTTDFAYKLRNSYHYTEIEKYKIHRETKEEELRVNMEELYLKITNSNKWPDDYIEMLNAMKKELNIILEFCRNSIGIKY